MIFVLLSFAAATQAFQAPPAPPPVPQSGSDAFARQQAAFEDELRRSCISEPGVKIIVESWSRRQFAASQRTPELLKLQQETAEAAFRDPVDMGSLERALRENARQQAERTRELAEDGIAVLKKLSSEDRAIYARRFTVMRPTTPSPTCPDRQSGR